MTRFPVFHAIMRGGTPPPFEHSPANLLFPLTVRRQLPAARALLIRCAPQEKFIVSIALAAIKAMIIVKLCDVTVFFDNFIETNEDKNVMKP